MGLSHAWPQRICVKAMGMTPADEDSSNKLLDVETQLRWLREIGFEEIRLGTN